MLASCFKPRTDKNQPKQIFIRPPLIDKMTLVPPYLKSDMKSLYCSSKVSFGIHNNVTSCQIHQHSILLCVAL